MGTFLAAAVLIIFAAYIAMYLGYYGVLIFGVLALAAAITAFINVYREITRRLDRIEKALGIEELPGESLAGSEQAEGTSDDPSL